MLQQLSRTIEKIDCNQPVGEQTDHFIAFFSDRCQFTEIVVQS